MEKKLAFTLISTSLFLFLFTFQNCGVYRSQDREDFNQNGVAKAQIQSGSTSSSTSSSNSTTGSANASNLDVSKKGCALISEAQADAIFGEPTEQMEIDGNCLISTFTNDSIGSNSVNCMKSEDDRSFLNPQLGDTLWPDTHADGSLPGGSFAREERSSNVRLQIVGTMSSTHPVFVCTFVYKSEADLKPDLSRALDRGFKLLHIIASSN